MQTIHCPRAGEQCCVNIAETLQNAAFFLRNAHTSRERIGDARACSLPPLRDLPGCSGVLAILSLVPVDTCHLIRYRHSGEPRERMAFQSNRQASQRAGRAGSSISARTQWKRQDPSMYKCSSTSIRSARRGLLSHSGAGDRRCMDARCRALRRNCRFVSCRGVVPTASRPGKHLYGGRHSGRGVVRRVTDQAGDEFEHGRSGIIGA